MNYTRVNEMRGGFRRLAGSLCTQSMAGVCGNRTTWRSGGRAHVRQNNEQLLEHIWDAHKRSRSLYRAPRIAAELNEQRKTVPDKTTANFSV